MNTSFPFRDVCIEFRWFSIVFRLSKESSSLSEMKQCQNKNTCRRLRFNFFSYFSTLLSTKRTYVPPDVHFILCFLHNFDNFYDFSVLFRVHTRMCVSEARMWKSWHSSKMENINWKHFVVLPILSLASSILDVVWWAPNLCINETNGVFYFVIKILQLVVFDFLNLSKFGRSAVRHKFKWEL